MARIKQRSDISVHIVGTFFFSLHEERLLRKTWRERERKIEFKWKKIVSHRTRRYLLI